MKSVLIALGFVLASYAGATETTTVQLESTKDIQAKMNSTEVGLQMSSINSGSLFTSIAGIHEFNNGYALGLRGLMPLEFSSDGKAYLAQLFGRVYLLNAENIMFLEMSGSQIFFSQISGTDYAASLGVEYGYKRQFNPQFSAGASAGIEYASARMSHNEYTQTPYLYNKVSVVGSYYF